MTKEEFSCKFKLPNKHSEEIKNTLESDENKDKVSFVLEENVLIIIIKSDNYKSFMKTIQFFMERYKLCVDTIEMCD